MPPTPFTADGVLRINYEVTSLEHQIDFYVDVTDMGGGTYEVTRNPPLTGTDPAVDVGEAIWGLIRKFWTSAVPAPTWELLRRDENILIPVSGGSLTGTGNGTGTLRLAQAMTITFKDVNQYLMRCQFAETIFAAPSHDAVGGVNADIDVWTASMIATPDGTELSSWVRVRTGNRPVRGLFVSVDTNDKFRRARGL